MSQQYWGNVACKKIYLTLRQLLEVHEDQPEASFDLHLNSIFQMPGTTVATLPGASYHTTTSCGPSLAKAMNLMQAIHTPTIRTPTREFVCTETGRNPLNVTPQWTCQSP
jgi:hypothetical protein